MVLQTTACQRCASTEGDLRDLAAVVIYMNGTYRERGKQGQRHEVPRSSSNRAKPCTSAGAPRISKGGGGYLICADSLSDLVTNQGRNDRRWWAGYRVDGQPMQAILIVQQRSGAPTGTSSAPDFYAWKKASEESDNAGFASRL